MDDKVKDNEQASYSEGFNQGCADSTDELRRYAGSCVFHAAKARLADESGNTGSSIRAPGCQAGVDESARG